MSSFLHLNSSCIFLRASLSCVFLLVSLSLCRCGWLYNIHTWNDSAPVFCICICIWICICICVCIVLLLWLIWLWYTTGAKGTMLTFAKSSGPYARWPYWSKIHKTQRSSAMWICACHWYSTRQHSQDWVPLEQALKVDK